jgi:hypothetical protein
MPTLKVDAGIDFMPTWEGLGSCAGKAKLMEPDGRDLRGVQRAVAVCRSCPVLAKCRAWLDSLPYGADPGGVVAGTVPGYRDRPALDESGMGKRCGTCGQVLPLTAFTRVHRDRPLLRTYCNACGNAEKRARKVDAVPGEELKTCPRCKTVRGRSRYYPNSQNADGLAAWCKTCFNDLKGSQ